jgi:hypothetical protein
VLVVYAVRSRQMRWFWLSFAYKSLGDAVAAWAILSYGVKDSLVKLTYIELGYVVFACVSILLLLRVRRQFGDTRLEASFADSVELARAV